MNHRKDARKMSCAVNLRYRRLYKVLEAISAHILREIQLTIKFQTNLI